MANLTELALIKLDKMSVFIINLVCLQLVSSETMDISQNNVRSASSVHMEHEVTSVETSIETYWSPASTKEATTKVYWSPAATTQLTTSEKTTTLSGKNYF